MKWNKLYRKKYRREQYLKNKEHELKTHKEWRTRNKEKWKKIYLEYQANNMTYYSKQSLQWRKNNPKKAREMKNAYRRRRNERDPAYKIRQNLSSRLCAILKRSTTRKSKPTMKLVGCSLKELKEHLQSKFKDGMNWDNYGQWHVDHIIPCAYFNLVFSSQQEVCFHYLNLQPLWAEENLKKRDKLNYEPGRN